MVYHGAPLPAAATGTARDAKRAFFCDLCQKGYARQNELEVHENSYDHQHARRKVGMQAIMRNSAGNSKRNAERRAEEKASGIRLNIGKGDKAYKPVPSTHKPPVWKKIGVEGDAGVVSGEVVQVVKRSAMVYDKDDPTQAKFNGWYEQRYRPEVVTASKRCGSGCRVCNGREIVLKKSVADDARVGKKRKIGSGGSQPWKQWYRD
nr:zinc finger protein [Quercus suber]